ncbi:MAG TPA: hypothetical protein VGV08_08710 [Casimicrobiaceae bacterium]|nr:hypothetical protein [Casimicrobiaceae bacterium]
MRLAIGTDTAGSIPIPAACRSARRSPVAGFAAYFSSRRRVRTSAM